MFHKPITPFINRARTPAAIERAYLPGETCYRCDGCDAHRETDFPQFCTPCDDFTDSYLSRSEDADEGDYAGDLADYLYDTRRSDDLLSEMGL